LLKNCSRPINIITAAEKINALATDIDIQSGIVLRIKTSPVPAELNTKDSKI
jgi:hypothetical protein